jgi:hypothetical protein
METLAEDNPHVPTWLRLRYGYSTVPYTFYLASTGETNIFLKDTDWSLAVGQVMVKVNRIGVDLLEGLGLVGNLETLA